MILHYNTLREIDETNSAWPTAIYSGIFFDDGSYCTLINTYIRRQNIYAD